MSVNSCRSFIRTNLIHTILSLIPLTVVSIYLMYPVVIRSQPLYVRYVSVLGVYSMLVVLSLISVVAQPYNLY